MRSLITLIVQSLRRAPQKNKKFENADDWVTEDNPVKSLSKVIYESLKEVSIFIINDINNILYQ